MAIEFEAMPPASVPRQYFEYALAFLRAMSEISDPASEFVGAYKEFQEKYPSDVDYEEDW